MRNKIRLAVALLTVILLFTVCLNKKTFFKNISEVEVTSIQTRKKQTQEEKTIKQLKDDGYFKLAKETIKIKK